MSLDHAGYATFTSLPDDALNEIFSHLNAKELENLIQVPQHAIRRAAMLQLWAKRDEPSIAFQLRQAIDLLMHESLLADAPLELVTHSLHQLAYRLESSPAQRIISLSFLTAINFSDGEKYVEFLNHLLIAAQEDVMLFLVMRSYIAAYLKDKLLYKDLSNEIYENIQRLDPNSELAFLDFLNLAQINHVYSYILKKLITDTAKEIDFIILTRLAPKLTSDQVIELYPYLFLNLTHPNLRIIICVLKILAHCQPKLNETLQQQTKTKLSDYLENEFLVTRTILPNGKLNDHELAAILKISASYSFLEADKIHELLIIFLTLLASFNDEKQRLAQTELGKLAPYLNDISRHYAVSELIKYCSTLRSAQQMAAFTGIPRIITYLNEEEKKRIIDALLEAIIKPPINPIAAIGNRMHQWAKEAVINTITQFNAAQISQMLDILEKLFREDMPASAIPPTYIMYFELLWEIITPIATQLSEENKFQLLHMLDPYFNANPHNALTHIILLLNKFKENLSPLQFNHLFKTIVDSPPPNDAKLVLDFLSSRPLTLEQITQLSVYISDWDLPIPHTHPRLCVLTSEQYDKALDIDLNPTLNTQSIINMTPYLTEPQLQRVGEVLAMRLQENPHPSGPIILCHFRDQPIILNTVMNEILKIHTAIIHPLLLAALMRETATARPGLFDERRAINQVEPHSPSSLTPSKKS